MMDDQKNSPILGYSGIYHYLQKLKAELSAQQLYHLLFWGTRATLLPGLLSQIQENVWKTQVLSTHSSCRCKIAVVHSAGTLRCPMIQQQSLMAVRNVSLAHSLHFVFCTVLEKPKSERSDEPEEETRTGASRPEQGKLPGLPTE